MATKATWGRLRVVGAIAAGLVLLLVLVLVLVNVFSAEPAGEASGDGPAGVGGEPLEVSADGVLEPPETEDPRVYGTQAAVAHFTYDTTTLNYLDLQRALGAWYLDLETEPPAAGRPDSIEEAILTSPLIGEEFYRTQSEQRMVVTAEVVGEPRVNAEHRDIEQWWADTLEMEGTYVVTTDLSVTYTFTDQMGVERVTTEPATLSAFVLCGQNTYDARPDTSCVLSSWEREFVL